MLPRVMSTTGTLQPSLALQANAAVDADAAVKPQISTAALANLRADVLLRLIETLLRHMPRNGGASGNRDLLETLLSALKTLPGREGEAGRKLADLIAKLPPELRPSVEKLVGTVLSSLPTRTLAEILRNPNGPEGQKLASLLATTPNAGKHDHSDTADAGRQQKPLGLTAQQLAVVGRHGAQQTAGASQIPAGDARTLQLVLQRIFDTDSTQARPLSGDGGAEASDGQDVPLKARYSADATAIVRAASRLPAIVTEAAAQADTHESAGIAPQTGAGEEADAATPVSKRGEETATRLPAPDQRTSAAALPVEAADLRSDETRNANPRQAGVAEEDVPTAASHRSEEAGRRQISAGTVQHAEPSALQASIRQIVAAEAAPAVLMQAIAQLVATLSEDEATLLRTLFEQPLDAPAAGDAAEAPEDARDGETGPSSTEQARPRTEPAQPAAAPARPVLPSNDQHPLPKGAEAAQAAAVAEAIDVLLPAAALREGVPLAFVPYLAPQDETEWAETHESEEEAAEEGSDDDGAEGGEHAGDEEGGDGAAEEPDGADLARKRATTAEMVGVIEPGLVFYQKLGDYWT